MKLYLCSYRIPVPGALFDLVGKSPEDTRVAIIPNAGDYYAERARAVKIREKMDYLQSFGLRSEVVDLRAYSDSSDLITRLSDFDLLWVSGGNTFCLRHEMRRSGFDEAIGTLLDEGIVYAGESAGAVAAGSSLKGIDIADNPEFAESVVYDGLALIPYFVLPHVDNDAFGEDVAVSRSIYPKEQRLELKDSQAAVINGSGISIVTATAER